MNIMKHRMLVHKNMIIFSIFQNAVYCLLSKFAWFVLLMRLQYVYTPYCSKHGLKGSTKIRQSTNSTTAWSFFKEINLNLGPDWDKSDPTPTYSATVPHCLRVFHICIAYQEKTEKEKAKQATFLLFRYYSATVIVILMICFSRKIIFFL